MDFKDIQLILMDAYKNKKPVHIILKNGAKYSGVVQGASADSNWTLQLLSIVNTVTLKEADIEAVAWL